MTPPIPLYLLPLLSAAVAAAHASPHSASAPPTAAVAAAASEPPHVVFDHPNFEALLDHRCALPYPDDATYTDKTICDALRKRDVEAVREVIQCITCFDPSISGGLHGTSCRRLSHMKCRFKLKQERESGSRKKPIKSTIFNEALLIMGKVERKEPFSWFHHRASVEDREVLLEREKRMELAEYNLNGRIRDFRTTTTPMSRSASPERLLHQFGEIFHRAGTALHACARNVVWSAEGTNDIKRIRKAVAAYVQAMEFNVELGPFVKLNLPVEDSVAWMRGFGRSFEVIVAEALEATATSGVLFGRRRLTAWLARSSMLADVMDTFPCAGHVPQILILKNWIVSYVRVMEKYQEFDGAAKYRRELEFEARGVGRRLLRRLPAKVPVLDLTTSLQTALNRGREVMKKLWTRACAKSFFSWGSYGLMTNATFRGDVFDHYRRSVPYLLLPAPLDPLTTKTMSCNWTAVTINAFGVELFDDLDSYALHTPPELRALDWLQTLDGLEHLLLPPRTLTKEMPAFRRTVVGLQREFVREVDVAKTHLRSWIDVDSFKRKSP